MKLLFSFFTLLIMSFASMSLAQDKEASDFAAQLKAWEQEIVVTDDVLTSKNMSDDLFEVQKTSLRALRVDAGASAERQRAKLKEQQEVLAALGDVPEDETQEDDAIRAKRNGLNEAINIIDGRLKQSNLIIAKIDAQITAIEQVQSERSTNKLLAKEPFPLTFAHIPTFFKELYLYASDGAEWLVVLLHVVIIGFIIFVSFPMARSLNAMFTQSSSIEMRAPLSAKRIVLVSLAAYLVFLMRFDMIALSENSILENACEALAAICLSLVLFFAFRKIRFVPVIFEAKHDFDHVTRDYSWLYNTARRALRAVLVAVPVAVVLGYVNLGLYVSFNIFASLMAIMMFIWLRSGFATLNLKLSDKKGDEDKEALSPMFITIIEPILALLCLLTALFFWGMTAEDFTAWATKYSNGIPIGDMTLDFGSIGSAIMLFFMLYVVMKVIQWFLSSRVFPYTSFDIGVKDAIIAITGYIGIVIAFLASMSALGIDMSKLAIIAGALSVGIGFGLQAIFSNFVSGLILLFERPVKVGDWVVVGEHQGLVKKIRVRSTEIETFWNSSIIVPNSQLISETVTNWTLHDRMGRVDIQVGVAYGSDTQKVKDLLLQVAADNPNVRKIPAPSVLFSNFGDSSLDFELRCFIRNIRDIYRVSSELRFAIDDLFREHNIEIPFPQRDVHIISKNNEEES